MSCECGAPADCFPVWYEILAEEQLDPELARWHNPMICVFLLQHRSIFRPRYADGQFRFLQLFVQEGIDVVNAVARSLRARNRGPARELSHPELDRYAGLGQAQFPTRFALSLHDLPPTDGGFTEGLHHAYGHRLIELAQATISAWRET